VKDSRALKAVLAATAALALVPCEAGARERSFSLIGGRTARTLYLSPCAKVDGERPPATSAVETGKCPAEGDTLVGSVRFALTAKRPLLVRVRYLPNGAPRVVAVRPTGDHAVPGSTDARVALEVEGRPAASGRVTVRPGRERAIAVRFAVSQTSDPSSLDGTVVLDVRDGRTTTLVPVPLSTAGDVRLEPDTVRLQCTWRAKTSCESKTFDLKGRGVPGLAAGAAGRTVRLGGDGDGDASVEIEGVVRDPANPFHATATVKVVDEPSPGQYSGSAAGFGDKSVTVQVRSALSLLVALALVVIGVVLGTLGPRLRAIARRRRFLLEKLDEALEKYRKHRAERTRPASWNMIDLVGDNADPGTVQTTHVDQVRGDIESARSDADLDDDTVRVLEIIARIQRWLRIEPAARRFHAVVDGPQAVPDLQVAGGARRWADSNVRRDAEMLELALNHEPTDTKAADDLVARVIRETWWQHRFKHVWTHAAAAGIAAEVAALDDELTTSVLALTAEQRYALDVRLDRLLLSVPQPPGDLPQVPDSDRQPNWHADPLSFRGWATLGSPEMKQVESRATGTGWRAGGAVELVKSLRLVDLVWTIVAILVASLVYLLTVYDDTWGSLTDVLTALLAGAGAKVAIDVAGLPLFRSLRLRSASGAGAEA
jgi:hypothetical protein